MTLRREEMRALSLIGGEATARSMPSMRKRTRKFCSYGSKWMSEAPRLIASTSTLLTNLTTGASSFDIASWPPSPPSSSIAPSSRFSRPSASSSPSTTVEVALNACSIARSICCSSIRIGSMMWLDWNLISSSACRLVGSDTPTNRRLPRLNSGSALCLEIRSSRTRRSGICARSSAWMSNSGMPNSAEEASATWLLPTRLFSTSHAPIGIFWRSGVVDRLARFAFAQRSFGDQPARDARKARERRWIHLNRHRNVV